MARWLTSAALLTVGGLLVGCGTDARLPSREQTFAQARHVALDVARAAAGPDARIETPPGTSDPLLLACTDRDDLPPGTPVSAEYAYRVPGARAGRGPDHLRRAATYLRRAGWEQSRTSERGLLGFDKDGYSLAVGYGRADRLLAIDITTPCVAPGDPDDPLADQLSSSQRADRVPCAPPPGRSSST